MEPRREKFVVIGAGPVGAMAAMYAAERGHEVEVYEFRNDLRDPSTIPLNFTKSINLSLSERGINAIRHLSKPSLLSNVMTSTVPMRGRMIHGLTLSSTLSQEAQDYDIHGRTNFACDRGILNSVLLDELEKMPNVKLFFGHKLVGADFKANKAWIEKRIPVTPTHPTGVEELEIDFDLMIGADGAHSAVRYHMMKFTRMDYSQTYIDTLWCEFRIEPLESEERKEGLNGLDESKFAISPYHLHIWPGKERMFIAIPSHDGSFTCTLFMPASAYAELDSLLSTTSSSSSETSPDSSSALTQFFDQNFPGVTTLIPPSALLASYTSNPHLPLISITCAPYHHNSSSVILGDSAHAMVPFYGQGMNCGLESVLTLFTLLDAYPSSPSGRAEALAEYSRVRAPDAKAIGELAMGNFEEMRSSVTNRIYKLRKRFEEYLCVTFPSLGVKTKYSMVSFENIRYSEVIERCERQERWIKYLLGGVAVSPLVVLGCMAAWRWRSFFGATRWTVKRQAGLGWEWLNWL